MSLFDRVALILWRDRYDYDPATGSIGAKHNISLWTRFKPARQRIVATFFDGRLWLAFVGGAFSILAAIVPLHLNQVSESNQQMNADTTELRLQCVDKGNGILTCRKLGNGNDEIIPAPDGDGSNGNTGNRIPRP